MEKLSFGCSGAWFVQIIMPLHGPSLKEIQISWDSIKQKLCAISSLLTRLYFNKLDNKLVSSWLSESIRNYTFRKKFNTKFKKRWRINSSKQFVTYIKYQFLFCNQSTNLIPNCYILTSWWRSLQNCVAIVGIIKEFIPSHID